MDDIEKRAREIADVLPAEVDASAWPNGYGDGWNDCARIAHEEILPAIIAALSAEPSVGEWPRMLLDTQPFKHRNDASRLWQLLDDEQACESFVAEAKSLADKCGNLSAAPKVPEGWVLVPVELTDEMMTAAEGCHDDWPATTWRKAWEAMIAAKPEPQV